MLADFVWMIKINNIILYDDIKLTATQHQRNKINIYKDAKMIKMYELSSPMIVNPNSN